jgi:hypothetical protein
MASPTSPTSPDSLPTEISNPDPALFFEFISTKNLPIHQLFLSSNPSTPLYTIEMHEPLSSKKPSILLHTGSSKTDPVVGIVKLGSQRAKFNTIGIGNPEAVLEEGGDKSERMVWERLQRMKKWSFRWYEFEFGGQVYTWRRTKDRWPKILKNLELRVGKEEDGELIAVWKGSTRMNVKRGSFFIRWKDEAVDEREWKRFEAVMLLTGFAIIEGYRRRSR